MGSPGSSGREGVRLAGLHRRQSLHGMSRHSSSSSRAERHRAMSNLQTTAGMDGAGSGSMGGRAERGRSRSGVLALRIFRRAGRSAFGSRHRASNPPRPSDGRDPYRDGGSQVIPLGLRVHLSTLWLPERHLWRNYHGQIVEIIDVRPGVTGFHYGVRFPDGTVGRCTTAELGEAIRSGH